MAEQRDKTAGKTKEVAGKLSGDEQMEAEGRSQKKVAEGQEAVENAGDKARGVARGLKEKFKKDR